MKVVHTGEMSQAELVAEKQDTVRALSDTISKAIHKTKDKALRLGLDKAVHPSYDKRSKRVR